MQCSDASSLCTVTTQSMLPCCQVSHRPAEIDCDSEGEVHHGTVTLSSELETFLIPYFVKGS